MFNWFFKWYYGHRRLKFTYTLDDKGFVAIVQLNKLREYLNASEEKRITELATHFSERGYLVEVME